MSRSNNEGPRRAPRADGAPRGLVVMLHGYGADGRDLIDLADAWADLLPHVAFFAPHAPQPCVHMPTGRQWFPLDLRDPAEYWRGVKGAAPHLHELLDAELARADLTDRELALVGFSQGTMMALHVGLRRAITPACILGYSGRLAGAAHLDEITVRPPVCLIHGAEDDVIPASDCSIARDALTRAGVPVDAVVVPGLDHSIDIAGIRRGGAFLRRALGLDPGEPPRPMSAA